ncbi:MAG: hypothetical protein N2257_02905 [Thermodesulfovibrionales bacterium]|nr:hypothetical protein [Thermodesulfovibrionales bacterium]
MTRYTKTEEAAGPARMPPGLSLILGPVIGFVYVVFLPFIGVVMVTVLTLRKVASALFSLVRTIANFGWRPLESYLAGRKKHLKK